MLSRRLLLAMMTLTALGATPAWPNATGAGTRRALSTRFGNFAGDFDAMLERRLVRLVVPYGGTLFFSDKGTVYGVTANGAQEFENWVNKTYGIGKRPLTVLVTPLPRSQLFDALIAGEADIAAGDITITEARSEKVAFSSPVIRDVREIVITRDDVADFDNVEALSGKEIAVGRSTSFHESLTKLNERLKASGKAPVKITLVPDVLEAQDLLEMTAAGMLPATVVDDWIAELWLQIVKGLKPHPKAPLREGGEIAWAVRRDNPKLVATINRAVADLGGNTSQWSAKTRSYLAALKQLHTATKGDDLQRFEDMVEIFRRYGAKHRFDPLLLEALAYEESRLQPNVRSSAGAIGLMQIKPSTAKQFGVGDLSQPDNNVNAGTQLLALLVDNYFKDVPLDEQNRTLFAIASYGMGAGALQWCQSKTKEAKLDPNLWFNNVEQVASARVGQETPRAIRTIYKYYVAYKLLEEASAARKAAVGVDK